MGAPFKLSSILGRTLRPHTHPRSSCGYSSATQKICRWSASFLWWMSSDLTMGPPGLYRAHIPGRNPRASDARSQDPSSEGEVVACGRGGSLILFNGSIWHGHTANISSEPRRSIQGYFVRRNANSGTRLDIPNAARHARAHQSSRETSTCALRGQVTMSGSQDILEAPFASLQFSPATGPRARGAAKTMIANANRLPNGGFEMTQYPKWKNARVSANLTSD